MHRLGKHRHRARGSRSCRCREAVKEDQVQRRELSVRLGCAWPVYSLYITCWIWSKKLVTKTKEKRVGLLMISYNVCHVEYNIFTSSEDLIDVLTVLS